ncbi:MAG: hypothetical protein RIM80_09080, partial [Alphaproteobacteria bacterium]
MSHSGDAVSRVFANGGDGDDSITVFARSVSLRGGDGDDDFLVLQTGVDSLTTATEEIFGEAGDDFIEFESTARVDGGSGVDTVAFSGLGALQADLQLGTVRHQIPAGSATSKSLDGSTLVAVENLIGLIAGDDVLSGTNGANFLDGRGGSNDLSGRGGNDILRGGSGSDRFFGGSGIDTAEIVANGS